jgi:hypothetical protein
MESHHPGSACKPEGHHGKDKYDEGRHDFSSFMFSMLTFAGHSETIRVPTLTVGISDSDSSRTLSPTGRFDRHFLIDESAPNR